MKLTYQQKKAINATDPFIMCVAAAGSAKTTVLSERIRLLLTERNVKAEDIVAITLANLAAEEMKKRLGDICYGAFIGTIHSYANQICIGAGIDTSEYVETMNFDKILEKALTIPDSRYPYVDYLLLDECQDCSVEDYKVIRKIHYANFFLVGDCRQTIYNFRGAYVRHFYNYYNDPNFVKYYLTKNFRCPPNILDYANKFVEKMRNTGPQAEAVKTEDGILEEMSFTEALEEIEDVKHFGDWAIVCRTNADIEEAERRLKAKEIPFLTFRSCDFNLEELEALLKQEVVKILTAHSSKGLQFKNVIAVGMKSNNDEENRISYVAATRAENNLFWCPKIATGPKTKQERQPIPTASIKVIEAKKSIISF